MKKINLTLLSFIVLILFVSCAHRNNETTETASPAYKESKGKLYTAYNMWYGTGGRMYCINYQVGKILPAGTEIKDVIVDSSAPDQSINSPWYRDDPYISFRTVHDDKGFEIKYQPRFHRRRPLKEYAALMFVKEPFEERTKKMTESEINAIRQGLVVKGMSKDAVIISVGVPSDHKTPDMNSDKWYYWKRRTKSKQICFDENDRAIKCGDQKKIVKIKESEIL